MLTFIEIANYKSIASTTLRLQKSNIVVGPNGAGKSNLTDAIQFVTEAVKDDLETAVTKRHGIKSIRRWSKTRPYNITISLNFENADGHGKYKFTISSSKGAFSIIEEEADWWGNENLFANNKKTPYHAYFKRDSRNIIHKECPETPFLDTSPDDMPTSELYMSSLNPRRMTALGYFLTPLYSEITSSAKYSIYPNTVRAPQAISTSDILFEDGSNLAAIIKMMGARGGNKDDLTRAMTQVLPILEEIRIISAGGYYVPVMRVKETADGAAHDLNLSQVSDGTLRMMGMLAAFYQTNAPRRIVLEEPEQMIHPGLLPVLVDASNDYLASKGKAFAQIFMTTHSPAMMDLYSPEELICAKFDGIESVFSPISERQVKLIHDRLFTAGELLLIEGFF
jgi:predicted ATPase